MSESIVDWFDEQDAATQLLVIKFGQKMMQIHQQQLQSLPIKKAKDPHLNDSTVLRNLLGQHFPGLEVLQKKDHLLKVRVNGVVLDLFLHAASVVERSDVDTFRHEARNNSDGTSVCGSEANPVPFFVVLESISIPKMATVVEAAPIGAGVTAYFVSGVTQYPERLITLLRMLTKTFLSSCAEEPQTVDDVSTHTHRSTSTAISQVQAVVMQQTELENFALGVVDRCRSSIQALNTCVTELRRMSTLASSEKAVSGTNQQLLFMRQKMFRAWDTLRDQQRPLTRTNTVETIARLYPGDRNGFKNPNSMANTLRYYSTSFTVEKTKYQQERK